MRISVSEWPLGMDLSLQRDQWRRERDRRDIALFALLWCPIKSFEPA
jgi:hypothetical protein